MRYLLTILFWGLVSIASATPLHQLVVFGDSLSDNGNLYEYLHHQLPKSPPYDHGRFSNGRIWVEHLLQAYFAPQKVNSHLLNYAFGGAGVLISTEDDDVLFTLNREIDTYLLAHGDHADPDSMFVIWIGGNNYLGLPDDMESATHEVQQGIKNGMEKLIQAGAKHITLINLPDLGRTPFAHSLEAEQPFHDMSLLHNQKLQQLVTHMQATQPTVQTLLVDANSTFDNIFQHPDQYGITNLTDACYDGFDAPEQAPKSFLKMMAATKIRQPLRQPNACQAFMFFDLVHPTTHAHQLIAERVHQIFEQNQVILQD